MGKGYKNLKAFSLDANWKAPPSAGLVIKHLKPFYKKRKDRDFDVKILKNYYFLTYLAYKRYEQLTRINTGKMYFSFHGAFKRTPDNLISHNVLLTPC